jgi:hypothetical protein
MLAVMSVSSRVAGSCSPLVKLVSVTLDMQRFCVTRTSQKRIIKLFNFFNPEKGSTRPSSPLRNIKYRIDKKVNAGKFREFGKNVSLRIRA